jgi:hypothetical protein
LICFDEAHHICADKTKELLFQNEYTEKYVDKMLFFTATPINKNSVCMYVPSNEFTISDTKGDEYYEIINLDEEQDDYYCEFDEDYTEWGARDSDFVYRLNLLHQIKQHPTLVVLHLFHVREFKNREKNMLRYKQRCEECKENFENIKKIRGVELLSETIPSSIQKNYNLLYLLTTLQNQNIRICLLKNSCYQATICGKLSEPLNIGISPVIELPSSDIKINILPFPNKTKFITIAGLKLEIPCPVTKYLENIYQKPWNQIKRGNI